MRRRLLGLSLSSHLHSLLLRAYLLVTVSSLDAGTRSPSPCALSRMDFPLCAGVCSCGLEPAQQRDSGWNKDDLRGTRRGWSPPSMHLAHCLGFSDGNISFAKRKPQDYCHQGNHETGVALRPFPPTTYMKQPWNEWMKQLQNHVECTLQIAEKNTKFMANSLLFFRYLLSPGKWSSFF